MDSWAYLIRPFLLPVEIGGDMEWLKIFHEASWYNVLLASGTPFFIMSIVYVISSNDVKLWWKFVDSWQGLVIMFVSMLCSLLIPWIGIGLVVVLIMLESILAPRSDKST
jgi:hypothetical protein